MGASYRVSDRLRIGAGVAISERLEDDPSMSPLLTLVWAITDDLTLRVGGSAEAEEGAARAELGWQALPELELAVGASRQLGRFRLDDSGVAPEGVGRDRSIPIYARARWQIARHVELSMMTGVAVGGELRLEDRHGRKVREEDYDPAPFATLRLAVGF